MRVPPPAGVMLGRLCRRGPHRAATHQGSPEGFPLWQGVWGMCPQLQNKHQGRVGGPNQRRFHTTRLPLLGEIPTHRGGEDNPPLVVPAEAETSTPPASTCRRSPNAASKSGDAAATSPYPLAPLSPTLPPCPPTAACHPISKDQPPLRSNAPPALAAGRLRVQGLPCLATTCFPLSISGHFSPRPSASVRLAPWQIRLVPLCRLFRRPPTGPSDHRPASAWQIRLVPLCRLVRRRSNPSCAASLQERAGRKKRDGQFKATQTLRRSRIPQAEGAGLALPTAAGGGAATTCSCR